MSKPDDTRVFEIDEGFGGHRITVNAVDSDENGGGGFVQLFDLDRDAIISPDFDVWDRIVAAVAKRREK